MLTHLRRLSIRTKLLWISLTLLIIPWLGYQYVKEMKRFLIQGQQDALMLSASGIASVLHERPELFSPATGVPQVVGQDQGQFVYLLPQLIKIDGNLNEWSSVNQFARYFTGDTPFLCKPNFDPYDFVLLHVMGYRDRFLYAQFNVIDDNIVWRDPKRVQLDNSDQVRMLLQQDDDTLERYVLVAQEAGRMSVYQVDEKWQLPLAAGEDITKFNAAIATNNWGYTVELRIPRDSIGAETKIGFFVVDVDDPTNRPIKNVLSTSPHQFANQPGQILLTSPELTKILNALDRPQARIWVIDAQQRVRAVVGGLTQNTQSSINQSDANQEESTLLGRISGFIESRFDEFLARPSAHFSDLTDDISPNPENIFPEVLVGSATVSKRQSLDKKAEILIAGYPITIGNRQLGTVVVEQSSHTILALHYRLIRSMTVVTLLVYIFVLCMLFIFAWRLIVRIRRLFNTTEQSITKQGRVIESQIPTRRYPSDELGDLGRSITSMLKRLSTYTRYLEGMPDTLAHELNNPLNVVSSSLQILETSHPEIQDNKHMVRARNGLHRLRSILTNLTEAANLEEAMKNEHKQRLDICSLLQDVVEGYKFSYPEYKFSIDVPERPVFIGGSAEHIAEMMDKLIDNAMQFSKADTDIIVRLQTQDDNCLISILNEGPLLPEQFKDRLFDPMVSYGKTNAKHSHLGLGLFVVRLVAEYHQGHTWAENRDDVEGVVVYVRIPLFQLSFI